MSLLLLPLFLSLCHHLSFCMLMVSTLKRQDVSLWPCFFLYLHHFECAAEGLNSSSILLLSSVCLSTLYLPKNIIYCVCWTTAAGSLYSIWLRSLLSSDFLLDLFLQYSQFPVKKRLAFKCSIIAAKRLTFYFSCLLCGRSSIWRKDLLISPFVLSLKPPPPFSLLWHHCFPNCLFAKMLALSNENLSACTHPYSRHS